MPGSNVSSVLNYFATANEGFTTSLDTSITAGATSLVFTDISGLTDATIFVGIIEPGETNEQTFTGTVDTGTNSITGVVWTRGTNVDHAGGVTIVDYVTGTGFNMMSTGILKEHNQDGTHSDINSTSITNSAGLTTATAHVTGATTLDGALGVGGAATLASLVLNGSLTGTGLGAQVTSLANAGTAGGTMYYVNLGGIKILWGATIAKSSHNTPSYTVTLPAGFFTTVKSVQTSVIPGADVIQAAPLLGVSTATLSIYFASVNNSVGATLTCYYFVIGT